MLIGPPRSNLDASASIKTGQAETWHKELLMRTYILAILAGLCLATITTLGCGNEGPIAPPINSGDVVVNDNGDGKLISREPVTITWGFVPRIDFYRLDYSLDGQSWTPITTDEIKKTHFNWTILDGANSDQFIVRAEGYRLGCDNPRSRALSEIKSVLPFGDTDHLKLEFPDSVKTGNSFAGEVVAQDSYNNIVASYNSEIILTFSAESLPPGWTLMSADWDISQKWNEGICRIEGIKILVMGYPPMDTSIPIEVWACANQDNLCGTTTVQVATL